MNFLTKFDIILIVLIFIVTISFNFLFATYNKVSDENATVVVYFGDNIYKKLPLNVDDEVAIKTDLGENIFKIHDGYVDMIDASCKDKYCIHEESIHYNNQTIVCLPNKIILSIVSSDESEIDTIAR